MQRSVLLLALIAPLTQCIELKKSPFDTSQGGLMGFLALFSRDSSGLRFVAAAGSGTVYTSDNGLAWTEVSITSGLDFKQALWTGTRWVLVGGSASGCSVYTSTDGAEWSAATLPTCAGQLLAVARNSSSGRIVAVGELAPAAPASITSVDDGLTWTTLSSTGTYRYAGLVFANNAFVAAQDPQDSSDTSVHTSDGTTAFAVAAQLPLGSIGKGNTLGAMIAVDNRVIVAGTDAVLAPKPVISASSTDNGASAWSTNSANIFGGNSTPLLPRALVANTGKDTLVAVGDSCLVDRTTDIAGLAWIGSQQPMSNCSSITWQGLTHDGVKFVAVGTGPSSEGKFAFSGTGAPADWIVGDVGAFPVYDVAVRP
jgi:hypothetical protein